MSLAPHEWAGKVQPYNRDQGPIKSHGSLWGLSGDGAGYSPGTSVSPDNYHSLRTPRSPVPRDRYNTPMCGHSTVGLSRTNPYNLDHTHTTEQGGVLVTTGLLVFGICRLLISVQLTDFRCLVLCRRALKCIIALCVYLALQLKRPQTTASQPDITAAAAICYNCQLIRTRKSRDLSLGVFSLVSTMSSLVSGPYHHHTTTQHDTTHCSANHLTLSTSLN
jgi:hypothetical protein